MGNQEIKRGVVFSPGDFLNSSSTTVLNALQQKHPAPSPPSPSSLLIFDHLPSLEDVELTGSHILLSARRIQGGAGPGGCDALLQYGAHDGNKLAN